MKGAVPREDVEVAYNVACRILGCGDDAVAAVEAALAAVAQQPMEAASRFALLEATCEACHALLPRRGRPLPSDAVPGPPGAGEAEIAAASMRLPVRQREALALDEVGHLPYEQIAAVMDIGRGAVAQLISRARINLSDELRGTVLASVAAPSAECERALPMIAMREDGQLDASSRAANWLGVHLAACDRCRLGVAAMRDAADTYRLWPLVGPPAALLGADEAEATVAEADDRFPRRRPALVAGLALLLLLAGFGATLLRDEQATPLEPAADAAPAPRGSSPASPTQERGAGKRTAKHDEGAAVTAPATAGGATPSSSQPVVTPIAAEEPASAPASRPDPSSAGTAVEPGQRTSTPSADARPKPVPTPAPAPQPVPEPAPAPVSEETAPAEDASEHPGRADPPGKAVGRPPR